MTTLTTKVELSNSELLLLDGKVSESVQEIINSIKTANEHAGVLGEIGAKILTAALEKGKFYYCNTSLTYCDLCKKSSEYAKYKSGPNRGRDNWKRPLYFSGIDFMRGFVSIRGFSALGGCRACVGELPEKITKYILEKNLPVELPDKKVTKWTTEEISECVCGAEVFEFDKYLDRTIMGDGWYYSGCPKCGKTSALFNRIWTTKGQRVIPIEGLRAVNTAAGWSRRPPDDVTIWDMRKHAGEI